MNLFGFAPRADEEPRPIESPADPATSRPPHRGRWTAVAVAAFALALGASLLWGGSSAVEPTAEGLDAAIEDALAERAEAPSTASLVFSSITPSLVVVQAEPIDADDTDSARVGSGVIINDRGDILTALHVVADTASIELFFADGSRAIGTLVSSEPENDIAVIEADRSPAAVAPAILGNARTLRVGDEVFAVGNPLGLTASLSAGVVSGLGRNIPFPDTGTTLDGLIQFDASVNRGSSGGPLLNSQGQVIGIVTALADPTEQGTFAGIGFAVPIDIAAGGAAQGPSQ